MTRSGWYKKDATINEIPGREPWPGHMPETSSETLMARRIILPHDDALRALCLASIVFDSNDEADEDMPTGVYE